MILNNLIKLPILKRAIPSILKKYIYWTNNYEKKVTIENISYDLDLRHLIDRRFFLHKGYEDELYYNLCKIIKKENENINTRGGRGKEEKEIRKK